MSGSCRWHGRLHVLGRGPLESRGLPLWPFDPLRVIVASYIGFGRRGRSTGVLAGEAEPGSKMMIGSHQQQDLSQAFPLGWPMQWFRFRREGMQHYGWALNGEKAMVLEVPTGIGFGGRLSLIVAHTFS